RRRAAGGRAALNRRPYNCPGIAARPRATPPRHNKNKLFTAPLTPADSPEINVQTKIDTRLSTKRKARSMTLHDLSRASGIAVSTISKAELGQIALSYEKFASLARGLGIDMTRLFMLGDSPQAEVPPTYVKATLDEARDYVTENYHYRLLL